MKISNIALILLSFSFLFAKDSFASPQQIICLNNNSGQIFIRTKCKKGESRFSAAAINSLAATTKGDQGLQGLSGEKGDKGDKGDKGETGNVGATGSQGPKGDTGIQGAKGDNGEQGPQEPKGDAGERGLQGEVGPQGSSGLNFSPSTCNLHQEIVEVIINDSNRSFSSSEITCAVSEYAYFANVSRKIEGSADLCAVYAGFPSSSCPNLLAQAGTTNVSTRIIHPNIISDEGKFLKGISTDPYNTSFSTFYSSLQGSLTITDNVSLVCCPFAD